MSMPYYRTCEEKRQLKSFDDIEHIIKMIKKNYEVIKIIKIVEVDKNTLDETIQSIEIQCIDNNQVLPTTRTFKINKYDHLIIDGNVYEVLTNKKYYDDFIKPVKHIIGAYMSALG